MPNVYRLHSVDRRVSLSALLHLTLLPAAWKRTNFLAIFHLRADTFLELGDCSIREKIRFLKPVFFIDSAVFGLVLLLGLA